MLLSLLWISNLDCKNKKLIHGFIKPPNTCVLNQHGSCTSSGMGKYFITWLRLTHAALAADWSDADGRRRGTIHLHFFHQRFGVKVSVSCYSYWCWSEQNLFTHTHIDPEDDDRGVLWPWHCWPPAPLKGCVSHLEESVKRETSQVSKSCHVN
jgi:hypothetical protein